MSSAWQDDGKLPGEHRAEPRNIATDEEANVINKSGNEEKDNSMP